MTRKAGPLFKELRFKSADSLNFYAIRRLYNGDIRIAPELSGAEESDRPVDDLGDYAIPTGSPPGQDPAEFGRIRNQVIQQLHPDLTIARSVHGRMELPPDTDWDPTREDLPPIEPVMAAPKFKDAMYEFLRDLSVEWLLPGIEDVPNNCVSLLMTNQRFVESFMVGLNHEMARELLWREYPTTREALIFGSFGTRSGTKKEAKTTSPTSTRSRNGAAPYWEITDLSDSQMRILWY